MNRSGTSVLATLLIVSGTLSLGLINSASAQVPALAPSDHCRDFPPEAIVSFADSDLAEVVNDAIGIDPGDALTCELAASLEELIVGTTINELSTAAPCALYRKNPLKAWKAFRILPVSPDSTSSID